MIGFLVGVFIIIALAFAVNAPTPPGASMAREAFIFGILSGIPAAILSFNHGSGGLGTAATGGAMTVFFALVYVALQKGGIINSVFELKSNAHLSVN